MENEKKIYKKCWYMVWMDLMNVYKEALEIGSLGSFINKGNVKFFPKEGDPKLITNERPITLRNVSYKIITKALALNLIPPLSLIVQPEKLSFIQGHYILDNVIIVWEGMEWIRESNQPAIILKN